MLIKSCGEYCSSGLDGYPVAPGDDAVMLVHIDELRVVSLQFKFGIHRIAGDDEDIARGGLVGGRAIHRNNAGTALCADGIVGGSFLNGVNFQLFGRRNNVNRISALSIESLIRSRWKLI
jgi:hypothetical protein